MRKLTITLAALVALTVGASGPALAISVPCNALSTLAFNTKPPDPPATVLGQVREIVCANVP